MDMFLESIQVASAYPCSVCHCLLVASQAWKSRAGASEEYLICKFVRISLFPTKHWGCKWMMSNKVNALHADEVHLTLQVVGVQERAQGTLCVVWGDGSIMFAWKCIAMIRTQMPL